MKTTAATKWTDGDVKNLPLPILGNYQRLGKQTVSMQFREVLCGWDNVRRLVYRVTSSSGIAVDWVPNSRVLTSWDPKIVRK